MSQGFGSAIVPDGCGFSLQNRGANFSLQPGHANVLAPSKRPYHTIIPSMVTETSTGNLIMPFGVMGSWMQPQGHVQVFLNMFKFGMDPQGALDAARLCISPGSPDGELLLEDGLDQVAAELQASYGRQYKVVKGWHERGLFGRGQIILQRADDAASTKRVLTGGSDPRGDGIAFGW